MLSIIHHCLDKSTCSFLWLLRHKMSKWGLCFQKCNLVSYWSLSKQLCYKLWLVKVGFWVFALKFLWLLSTFLLLLKGVPQLIDSGVGNNAIIRRGQKMVKQKKNKKLWRVVKLKCRIYFSKKELRHPPLLLPLELKRLKMRMFVRSSVKVFKDGWINWINALI